MKGIRDIFRRYLSGSCTSEELEYLFTYFREDDPEERLLEQLDAELQQDGSEEVPSDELHDLVNRNGYRLKEKIQRRSSFRYTAWTFAAAALILTSMALWFWTGRSKSLVSQSCQVEGEAFGMPAVSIVTDDGERIDLSSEQSGILVGGVTPMRYADGSPIEGVANDSIGLDRVFELVTRRGATYQITLSDGTQVWLNALSRLSYPQRFGGASREVMLQGEAYFVVAQDQDRPFIVKTWGQRVAVLGTEFNISAYEDEGSIRTTLVTGSVKVAAENTRASSKDRTVFLRPGEQSILSGGELTTAQVDPLKEAAWRGGRFYFENRPIGSVMKQLARWYDIEVIYEKGSEEIRFSGSISRHGEIEEVLKSLALTKTIQFRKAGRRITVMP